MSVRLSDIYCDARELIEETLGASNRVIIKHYGSLMVNPCDVTHYHIESVENIEGFANIDLTITYRERIITKSERFETVERTKNLRVLSTYGDNTWSFNMINKIWDGDYPSSVAVNKETGVVYLFNVRVSGIELVEFGALDESQFMAFNECWNDREPFRIMLDEIAMFKYIDGAEGYNYLKSTLFVELNCVTKIRVYCSKQGII